ncbi:hypothetical protein MMC10_010191 [Thelotrema lepadinum]|nr:hypothetical protein [Thelotrema lepadinum]
MSSDSTGEAPSRGVQQGEHTAQFNTDYQDASYYLDDQFRREIEADMVEALGAEFWNGNMTESFAVDPAWAGTPGDLGFLDHSVDASSLDTPPHSDAVTQSTPLSELSVRMPEPQASVEAEIPSEKAVEQNFVSLPDNSDRHSTIGEKALAPEVDEPAEDLTSAYPDLSPLQAYVAGSSDTPATAEQDQWVDPDSVNTQPTAFFPQQNINLDGLDYPLYSNTAVLGASQSNSWLLTQPFFAGPTPYPWFQQAGIQANAALPPVQAGMAGPQAHVGAADPQVQTGMPEHQAHVGVNGPAGQSYPKSPQEIEQIKAQLNKVAYPTTIEDVPGLMSHYPQAPTNDMFWDPENPEDRSSFTLGEESWSVETPPAILGMLDPDPDYAYLKHLPVGTLKDARSRELHHVGTGFPIRNLPYIPRYLSSQVSEMAVEVLMRRDPRVTYSDIRSRQPAWMQKQAAKEINALNNRRARRVRTPLNTRCWSGKYSDRPTKTLVQLLDSLTEKQIEANTTWIITEQGVHPPNNPNYMLDPSAFKGVNHRMSPETAAGMEKLQELRAKAAQWGVGHWSELPRDELPREWSMRQQGKRQRREAPVKAEGGEENENGEGDEDEDVQPRKRATRRRRLA